MVRPSVEVYSVLEIKLQEGCGRRGWQRFKEKNGIEDLLIVEIEEVREISDKGSYEESVKKDWMMMRARRRCERFNEGSY